MLIANIINMSCGTNRCALRRFDGHGSSSYRPSNPEATKAFNSSIQAMLAERARQDSGIFMPLPIQVPQPQPQPSSQILTTTIVQKHPVKPPVENETYYSLSDSKIHS
jgi:hypothetical protein